jgi:UDP-N-acetylmuramate dehydrogenase
MAGPALSTLTTLGVGGPAGVLCEVAEVAQLAGTLDTATSVGSPVLVLGGGSNVVVADAGFPGTVLRVAMRGVSMARDGDDVVVTAAAGEPWPQLVDRCVAEGLAGTECLSGIPGWVGATPVQNVGAYGQEVSQVVSAVGVWDRQRRRADVLGRHECRFGYRDSVFKHGSRYVVTSVSFRLAPSAFSAPLRYGQLADRLGVALGGRVPLAEAAEAVLQLRRSKGMVLDPSDPDTRSAGSFFVNPVLMDDQISKLREIAPGVPVWPAAPGAKVPAAWLVENAGFPKGYRRGTAAISSKHALALTVVPGGTAADLLALAREVRDGVERHFGVRLEPEPLLVGTHL